MAAFLEWLKSWVNALIEVIKKYIKIGQDEGILPTDESTTA